MQLLLPLIFSLLSCILPACANVEKVVFLAPRPTSEALHLETIRSPYLELLSPTDTSLRRQLHASFEPILSKEQSEAWVLLDALNEGRRYEVRVCWSATQPTAFDLSVHDLSTVVQEQALSSSLRTYLDARRHAYNSGINQFRIRNTSSIETLPSPSSIFFHISATADYFSTNQELMTNGLVVDIDIILDPFLFNILPQSLIPTVLYILTLAVLACRDEKIPLSIMSLPRPIFNLPLELLLMVFKDLDILSCPAAACALYRDMNSRGLVASVSSQESFAMSRMAIWGQPPIPDQARRNTYKGAFRNVPAEILYMIGDHLDGQSKLNFAIATWHLHACAITNGADGN